MAPSVSGFNQAVSLDEPARPWDEESFDTLADTIPDPHDQMAEALENLWLDQVIARCFRLCRHRVERRVCEGLLDEEGIEETAAALGIARQTVSYHRIKLQRRFSRVIAEEGLYTS